MYDIFSPLKASNNVKSGKAGLDIQPKASQILTMTYVDILDSGKAASLDSKLQVTQNPTCHFVIGKKILPK